MDTNFSTDGNAGGGRGEASPAVGVAPVAVSCPAHPCVPGNPARACSDLFAVNLMLEMLERNLRQERARLERLKRFFSPTVAEWILAGSEEELWRHHRQEVTVVFVDLRGFTAFAESAEPEEVMRVLHEYYAEIGRLALDHEGTIERFTGDGIMIFFNDPVTLPDPAGRAVRMTLAIRRRVAGICDVWRKRGHELDWSAGIALGFATIGAIGFDGRWDYGAIGPVTNLAARLCAEARPGQILISARVRSVLEPALHVEFVGELRLKGLQRPVPAFNVLGLAASD